MKLGELLTITEEELLKSIENNKLFINLEINSKENYAELLIAATYLNDEEALELRQAIEVYFRRFYKKTIKDVSIRLRDADDGSKVNIVVTYRFEEVKE